MNEELKIIITAEIDKLRKDLKTAQTEIGNFEQQGSSGLSKFGKAAGVAGKAVAAGLAAAGAAIVAGGAALIGLAESTREYRTEQAKLVTAFESAGSSAETAKKTYNDLYRVLGDSGQATEAANLLAQLTNDQQALSEWTKISQGVYATFGDSLPVESLAEAANETAKTGEITGALADALNWAGVSEEEFAEQLFWANSEAEREKLIRNTLNGLYSEAAEGYEENAASILSANEAQAKLTESLAALGAAVEPIVTIFKGEFATILSELVPHITTFAEGLLNTVNGIAGGTELMKEGLSGLLDGIIAKITETVGTTIPLILEVVGELLPQLTETLLNALPTLINIIFEAASQILVTLGEILPEILAQIVAILPQLIDTILANIPVLLQAAITFLLAIVQAIPQIIPPLIAALPQVIDSIINLILVSYPLLIDGAVQLLLALVDAIPQIIPPLVNAIPQITTSLINGLIKFAPQLMQGGMHLFMGLVTAAINIIPELLKALGSIVKNIKDNLVEKLKGLFNFTWELPKIKMPKFSVTPDGWKIGDLLKGVIPKLGITWNAKGGVFDKPTLMSYGGSLQGIGEAGAEAVVPLENNLEWLDKLANMLNQKMGGSDRPIVLQVDGKTFARTVINTVNADTRQKGKLALNIV